MQPNFLIWSLLLTHFSRDKIDQSMIIRSFFHELPKSKPTHPTSCILHAIHHWSLKRDNILYVVGALMSNSSVNIQIEHNLQQTVQL